jgi:hypothetical protein
VAWKGDKRLVTDKKEIDVVESSEQDYSIAEPEGVIIGENGKIWAQGRIVGGVAVAGESACVELQVKNHSSKKVNAFLDISMAILIRHRLQNTGLSITLTRMLHFSELPPSEPPPLQISDTLLTVAFRGPDYIIPPGAEGVASLVFDVPKHARGVRGGMREADEGDVMRSEPLFEVRCYVGVKMTMGIGRYACRTVVPFISICKSEPYSKDIVLHLPVKIVHPAAIPQLPVPPSSPYSYPFPTSEPTILQPPMSPMPYLDLAQSFHVYPSLSVSPPFQPYLDQGHVWAPPPAQPSNPYQFLSQSTQYYSPPLPMLKPLVAVSSSASTQTLAPPGITNQQQSLHFDQQLLELPELEEGKGERASRIAQHLRLSSRNRSASPQSHRFPVSLAQQSLPVVIPEVGSLQSPLSQGVVHSPRPFLSPKHSFVNSLPKSERVEALERMAEEVNAQSNDLSGDIPKVLDEYSYAEKTLPAPPVPSRKRNLQSPPTYARPQVANLFAVPEAADATLAPPTPTLTAITPSKQPRAADFRLGQSESGLDALERRLLVEVGTRKQDLERRPDVRTILPVSIPQPNAVVEPLHDSAISSLTLAEHDSDERTHKGGKSSLSGDDIDAREANGGVEVMTTQVGATSRETVARVERSEGKGKGKKKERAKDGEVHRFRKAAKGRVTAWLGGIDPNVPPETPPSPQTSKLPMDLPTTTKNTSALANISILRSRTQSNFENTSNDMDPGEDTPSSPNPRSSGFVPIGTIREEGFSRHPALRNPSPDRKVLLKGMKRASTPSLSEDQTKLPPLVLRTSLARTPSATEVTRVGSQPVLATKTAVNVHRFVTPSSAKPSLGQSVSPLPKTAPQRPVPEIKYDVRSARGGRGGKVTAVASIWASGSIQPSSKVIPRANVKGDLANLKSPILRAAKSTRVIGKSPPPNANASPSQVVEVESPPKLVDLAGTRSRPAIKSPSVPAIISSSHATPMLSTTASLARVTNHNKIKLTAVKSSLPPTVSETPPEMEGAQMGGKDVGSKSSPHDLVFGKARLRDLIKKYQDHGS